MQVNYFEEFPGKETLSKAKLLKRTSTIFLAARSLNDFKRLSKQLKKINPRLEAAYWPVLSSSYWLSPFSDTSDLERLNQELKIAPSGLKVLFDLELPILHKKLFFKNLIYFKKNKDLIKQTLRRAKQHGLRVYTAEYPYSIVLSQILNFLGVTFPTSSFPHTKIFMFYTSVMKFRLIKQWFGKSLSELIKASGLSYEVGLGTIAEGIIGHEPKLSALDLEKDLAFVKSCGVKNVAIFRLGGPDKNYLGVINKFT